MLLAQLQALLARLYDVPGKHAIMDFLITDPAQAAALAENRQATESDEQVLVQEDAEAMQVSVYIAAEVLQRLADANPFDALHGDNLADFCTALEGVSHFHYLTWRAEQMHEVSLLELELQAEVDKYVAALYLLTTQSGGALPAALHYRLFDAVRYHEHLDTKALTRYQTANRGAANFCQRLERAFLRGRCIRAEAWLREMRRFYRLSRMQKLRCAIA